MITNGENVIWRTGEEKQTRRKRQQGEEKGEQRMRWYEGKLHITKSVRHFLISAYEQTPSSLLSQC